MKKHLSKALQILITVFILLMGVFLFNATKTFAADIPERFKKINPEDASQRLNEQATGLECAWQNTSSVKCSIGGGSSVYATYSLDLESSKTAGHLVFAVDYGNQSDQATAVRDFGYVHFSGNSFNDAFVSTSSTDVTGGAEITNVSEDRVPITLQPERTDRANICSLSNFKAGCINGYIQNGEVATTLNQQDIDSVKAVYEDLKEKQDLLNACNSSNAPLPFIFCPILNGITNAIGGLIGGAGQVEGPREGLLISFLSLPPFSSEPGSVLSTVLGNVVDIANILYILIFLVLIFAGSIPFLNLDSYTIKKTLPKFILAVILTQFSLQICSIIVDFFNLLGLAIPNVLFGISQGAQTAALTGEGASTLSKVGSGVGAAVGISGAAVAAGSIGWILILLIAIAALISAIVAIVYLIIRYFVLFTLVILSPIAFVSWVLPGTEKFFKQWWTNFIKLNAMFVTIMAMLSASIVLSAILANIAPIDSTRSLIASIIPIIALLLVPKTLKWTTQGMNAIATGALNAAGTAGSKANNYGKQQAGKLDEATKNRLAATNFGSNTRLGRGLVAGPGGFIGTRGARRKITARANKERGERSSEVQSDYNNFAAETRSITDQMTRNGAGAAAIDAERLRRAREIVRRTGNDTLSRQALMGVAAQSGDTATLRALQSEMTEQQWNAGVNANYSAFDGAAQYRTYDASYAQRGSIDLNDTNPGTMVGTGTYGEQNVSGLSSGDLMNMSGRVQGELASSAGADHLNPQAFIDASADSSGRSRIGLDLRQRMRQNSEYVLQNAAAGSDAANQAQAILNRIDAQGNWV